MTKVLVTSGNTRIAYCLCKSLRKRAYEVYIGDRHRFNMAAMSRHCAGSMTYSSPFTEQEAFIDEICDFSRSRNIDIVVPVLEETYTLAKHREKLQHCQAALLLPKYSQILALHDKGRLMSMAKRLGILIPDTWELQELLSDRFPIAELPAPAIIKPKQGGGGWGMHTFSDPVSLLAAARHEIDEPEQYIVQSIIRGQNICACAIYYEGQCITRDSYISTTAYPLHVGQSTTRQSHIFQEALDSLKTLLDHLHWHGVCEMDFIVDQESGRCFLVDANPRFWGSVMQNIAAGVDYPWYYARLAQGDIDFTPGTAQDGIRTRWLGGDLMRMVAECKEAGNKGKYLLDALRSRTRYAACDDWDITDPMPFITWGLNMIAGKIFSRKKDSLPGIWQ